MNKTFSLSALAIAVAASQSAIATNDKLEEVIITSSRIEMPLRQVGTSVSIISGDEIQQRGFNSLFDILRSQPAIAVSNSGGAGKASSLRIRGEEGYRTLVMIDGIDISDTSGPQIGPRVEQILSSGIQRVEILRGPQGLMYGADAGGVVNITSISPGSGLGGDVSAEGGKYGTRQFGANVSGGNESVDFSLSATDFETDGFNARTTDIDIKDDDGYQNTTLHGKLGWNVSDALRLEAVYRDVSGDNEFDDCFTTDTFLPTNKCSDSYDQSAWRVAADLALGAFTHQLSYSGNDNKSKFYAEDKLSFWADGDMERVSYLGSFSSGDKLKLIYGADFENESIDDGTFDTDRDQDGYYAEYQGSFSNALYLTAGLRYDDNEDFGTHTSYRASAAYLFDLSAGELKLRGTYGTGFRAPSLYEIAYNGGAFAFPPASEVNLSEETSEGFDLGVSWYANSGLYLEAVYFDQSVSDEIYFDLVNFSGYLQGSGDTNSTGIELIGEITVLDSLSFNANYTYNDTENVDGSTRIRRPEHLANIGVNWRALNDALVLGLNVRGSYGAEDSDGSSIDDYQVVDINASFEVLKGLEVYGRVENLLDEDYEEVPTYNTSGLATYAGIRYSF